MKTLVSVTVVSRTTVEFEVEHLPEDEPTDLTEDEMDTALHLAVDGGPHQYSIEEVRIAE